MTPVATETCVPTQESAVMLNDFVSHIEHDHDITVDTDDDGGRFIENAGFRITMSAAAEGLRIRVTGPSPDMLVFFKDAIAQHVAEFDAEVAKSLRWTGETSQVGALPDNFRILTLSQRSEPMPGLVRATVTVEDDALFSVEGLHLRMM